MSDQLNLLEVPKDRPSYEETARAKINEFKLRVGIWTHNAPGKSTREYPKWMAMLLPANGAGTENYSDHKPYCKSDDPLDIMAGYCRIMDDTGRIEYGHTEKEAIQNLCSELKIECDL